MVNFVSFFCYDCEEEEGVLRGEEEEEAAGGVEW
jgi:hypothetical protein